MMWWILLACCLRLILMFYGEWQDKTMAVKYTDVDYHVFSDAAGYLAKGKSPYKRATYRYTPLLAQMLLPNIILHPAFGKVLFIMFDVLTGVLIYQLLCNQKIPRKTAKYSAFLWLFNPLPMTVSSRGNAESIMNFLVVLVLYFLHQDRITLSAITYALSVHFKIYPVTYALPIYLFLDNKQTCTGKDGFLQKLMNSLWPNRRKLKFIFASVPVFILLTWMYFKMYGWQFLEETYLYHVTRKDIKHNFSPYFYMLYLSSELEHTAILSVIVFLPQLMLILLFSWKFYNDLPWCWFLHTFTFVTFNKVCTSQYFLWYLGLLPLIVPNLSLTLKKTVLLTLLWFLGQAIWLAPAYYLEFEGQNTLIYIWLAGLVYFTINIYIVCTLISHYKNNQKWKWSGVASKTE